MKCNNLFPAVLLSAFLASCSVGKEIKLIKENQLTAKESKYHCFVKLNDGTLNPYQKLSIKRPPLVFEYLQGDGKKINLKANEIQAFQTEDYYAERVYDQKNIVIGKLPFNELFATRLRNGKIELFMITEMIYYGSDKRYTKNYFVRKGSSEKLQPLSAAVLHKLVEDNSELDKNFKDYYSDRNPFKGAMKVLDVYNK